METIKIRYVSDAIGKLAYIENKSDWIDLRSAEEVSMKKGEFRLISLGVAMKLPKGYEAHVAFSGAGGARYRNPCRRPDLPVPYRPKPASARL